MNLSQLFRGANVSSMHQRLLRFAQDFGVTGMRPPERIQNTRRVLAVSEYARTQSKLQAFREAAMDAHWRHGKDLEADDVLQDLAREVGLSPEEALKAADDPHYQQIIDATRAEANAKGVTGIPTFFFGSYVVVGCQPYETLAIVAQKQGAKPKVIQ